MNYIRGIMCLISISLGLSHTVFSSTPSLVSQSLEHRAVALTEKYADIQNHELSWYCLIDEAIALSKEHQLSEELIAALDDARDKTFFSLITHFKPFSEEAQTKFPETIKQLRNKYTVWQLRKIAVALMERNRNAPCEKQSIHMDDCDRDSDQHLTR